MVDTVAPETRSRMMSRIRGESTSPELLVRSYLHSAGLRFRINDRRLPGRPDLSFVKPRVALFVHGCFWHRHRGCRFACTPATRADFWSAKFSATVERDARVERQLRELGWRVLTVWECELSCPLALDEIFWAIRAVELE